MSGNCYMFNVKCGEVKIQWKIQANVHDMLWHDGIDPVLSHIHVPTKKIRIWVEITIICNSYGRTKTNLGHVTSKNLFETPLFSNDSSVYHTPLYIRPKIDFPNTQFCKEFDI